MGPFGSCPWWLAPCEVSASMRCLAGFWSGQDAVFLQILRQPSPGALRTPLLSGIKGAASSLGLASRGIEDELFVGVAALEKLVRLSSSLERKSALATEAKSARR